MRFLLLFVCVSWCSFASSAGLDACARAWMALQNNAHRDLLLNYELAHTLRATPEADLRDFNPTQGVRVTRRDAAGNALEAEIVVLAGNPDHDVIRVVGDHNGWRATDADKLERVPGTSFFKGTIRNLRHGMEYRLEVNGRQLLDPAATTYTARDHRGDATPLNAVFWDFDRPGAFRPTAQPVDLRGRPLITLETDAAGLVEHWNGGPPSERETYKFITESGVIEALKERGYTAIEFLPLNPSADPAAWQFRYQVFGLYGPDSRYGTPDDYARMVDAFNRAGIAVIVDTLFSHYPRQVNSGARAVGPIGLTNWTRPDGQPLYGNWDTPWGTSRYDYTNPEIRRFLIESTLNMMKHYGVSGSRLDDLGEGIWKHGAGGGPQFVREMVDAIRRYNPGFLTYGEIFVGHPDILRARTNGGAGLDVRHDAPLFGFIRENMLRYTEQVDMNALRNALRGPWQWGEVPLVGYATSHDEAANNSGGASGQYVASLIRGNSSDPNITRYIQGKSKAFGTLAFFGRSAVIDMLQLRVMQEGNFSHQPGVRWDLLRQTPNAQLDAYFTRLSRAVGERDAFAFQNLHPDVENHIDDRNKIISFYRIDHRTGKRYYGIINLGHQAIDNYAFGIHGGGRYRIVVDGDRTEFGGTGVLHQRVPTGEIPVSDEGRHDKPKSLVVPHLAPFGTILFEEI